MKQNTSFASFHFLAASMLVFSACSTMGGGQSSGTASEGMAGTSQPMSMSQMMDEMALNELHHINQKEIAMSEMAEKKAQSPEVKKQAAAIMADHKTLEAQVQAAADAQRINLASFTPSTYEKATMDRLGQLSGAQFDQAFMRQMMMSHQMASQQLRVTRNHVTNPLVTKLINQTMPKIAQHTRMTQQSAGVLGEQEQGMSEDGMSFEE